MKRALGYDPGRDGALAEKDERGVFSVIEFKKRVPGVKHRVDRDWKEVSDEIFDRYRPGRCAIEDNNSRPGDDPYTMFHFGRNTGVVEGILIAYGYTLHEVVSRVWQYEFGLGGTYPNETARKQAHKKTAQKIVDESPSPFKVTKPQADAILLCEYESRFINGSLTHGKDETRILRAGTGIKRTVVHGGRDRSQAVDPLG